MSQTICQMAFEISSVQTLEISKIWNSKFELQAFFSAKLIEQFRDETFVELTRYMFNLCETFLTKELSKKTLNSWFTICVWPFDDESPLDGKVCRGGITNTALGYIESFNLKRSHFVPCKLQVVI